MNLIGICGRARSGKDTIANILVKEFGFTRVALADPIKRAARDFFDLTWEQCWGDLKDTPDERYPITKSSHRWHRNPPETAEEHLRGEFTCLDCGKVVSPYEEVLGGCQSFLTPRHVFQQFGTEIGRTCYPTVWVDYAMRVAKELLHPEDPDDGVPRYSPNAGVYYPTGVTVLAKGVVISDVRYENEADRIVKEGGVVWRVCREDAGIHGKHSSEELAIPEGYIGESIENDGSIEDLEKRVRSLMARRK